MRDYYEILGVDKDASADQLKRAYRELALKFHPDKNPGDHLAEERFKEATVAYEVLSDSGKRLRYDRFGHSAFRGGFGGWKPGGFAQNVTDMFSDVFGDILGRRSPSTEERGADRTATLEVDFRTAAFGGERALEVVRHIRCDTCTGTGSKPGSAPQICHACGGGGHIKVQQGLFQVNKKCTYCRARGKIITHPCETCRGLGKIERVARLKVRIPPGSSDGTVIRYAGEGQPGTAAGPPGDLRVTLELLSHPIFTRDGADVLCELPVGVAEVTLGAQIEVPTLDGIVRMKVPAGTQTGAVLRLRGKGVPKAGGGRGDQHVTLRVETPTSLGDGERQQLEVLNKLDDDHYPERAAFWQRVK